MGTFPLLCEFEFVVSEIEVKLLATDDFPEQIEEIIRRKSKSGNIMSYMDAILFWCSEHMLEEDIAGEIVVKFPYLMERVQIEAEDLNLLKEKSARIDL